MEIVVGAIALVFALWWLAEELQLARKSRRLEAFNEARQRAKHLRTIIIRARTYLSRAAPRRATAARSGGRSP
jgi:hypothetical protein